MSNPNDEACAADGAEESVTESIGDVVSDDEQLIRFDRETAMRTIRTLFLVAFAILLVDQATKLAVAGFDIFGFVHVGMEPGQRIPLLGDIVRLTYVLNPGMAFGIDLGVPMLLGLFSIGAAVFIGMLLLKAGRRGEPIGLFHTALALILGGAVGNLIDRVFYGVAYGYANLFSGKVVDFIDVDIPDITLFGRFHDRFYIFNVADAAVSVGIVLLLISYPAYQRRSDQMRRQLANESSDPALVEPSPTGTALSKD